jgi:hypothetical protein
MAAFSGPGGMSSFGTDPTSAAASSGWCAYLEQISHSSHFLWHSGDVRKLRAGKVSRSDKFIQPESAAAGMGRWMAMFTGVIDLAKRSRSRP